MSTIVITMIIPEILFCVELFLQFHQLFAGESRSAAASFPVSLNMILNDNNDKGTNDNNDINDSNKENENSESMITTIKEPMIAIISRQIIPS